MSPDRLRSASFAFAAALLLGTSGAVSASASAGRRLAVPVTETEAEIRAYYAKCCPNDVLPLPFRWGVWIRGGQALEDSVTTQTRVPRSNETASPKREARRAHNEANALAKIAERKASGEWLNGTKNIFGVVQ